MILHVTEAKYLKEFLIELSFNDGREGVVDLRNSLDGDVFEPLRDQRLFSKLFVHEELDTVAWPNGADLAPEYLYFLAFKNCRELQPLFTKWGYT